MSVICAEFLRQRLFVFASTQRHGLNTHLSRVLHTEMSESADPLHGNDVTDARTRISQCTEHSNSGAHEWRSFFGW